MEEDFIYYKRESLELSLQSFSENLKNQDTNIIITRAKEFYKFLMGSEY